MPAEYDVSDGMKTLSWLVREYSRGSLRIPPFQRKELLWPMEKRMNFLERTASGVRPIGVIVLYFLDGDPRACYILDGLQRISVWHHWTINLSEYGLGTEDTIWETLEQREYPVQVRKYLTHKDAADDFQRLNSGLVLTGYELNICHLAVRDDWKAIGPVVDNLHNAMDKFYAAIRVRGPKQKRKAVHLNYRHNIALLYRHAFDDTVTVFDFSYEPVGRKLLRCPEYMLANAIDSGGAGKLQSMSGQFQTFLDDTAALLISRWQKVVSSNGADPSLIDHRYSDTFLRFLLETRIIAKSFGTHVGKYGAFVDAAIELWLHPRTGEAVPKSRIYLPGRNTTEGFYKSRTIEMLGYLEAETGIALRQKERRENDTTRPPLAVGLVGDHDERDYGNGPTTPEVGSINSAKGKRSRKEYDADIAARL